MSTAITPLEAVLRRDRAVVLAGLVAVTLLAWAYVVYLVFQMRTMDMAPALAMPQMQSWKATQPGPGPSPDLRVS